MQKRVGKYQQIEEIGKGQYGLVYKGVDLEEDKRVVAVKQVAKTKVNKSDLMRRLFVAEVQVMQAQHLHMHRNLLSLQDFIETGNNYYLVIRFCKDGDQESRLKKKKTFKETEAIYYMKQIMNGFTELYKHKIMHRDFKQANIFLDGYELVIGDFGFAKMGEDMATTKLGTPYNMAPELLLAHGKVPYTSKADQWSIGICFFQMLYGTLPFEAFTMDELKKEVVNRSGKNLPFRSDIIISLHARDLLTRQMQVDPNKRISWNEFFNHAIFKDSAYPESLLAHANDSKVLMHTSQIVEEQFNSNRLHLKEIGNLSDIQVLPDPLELCMNDELPQGSQQGNAMQSTDTDNMDEPTSFEYNKNRYLHERNKQICLFAATKKVRDLTKIESFKKKFGILYTTAFCLCKKSILFYNIYIKSLKAKVNTLNLPHFTEWLEKQDCSNILKSFGEDFTTAKKYHDHLLQIITDIHEKNEIHFDVDVLNKLMSSSLDLNILHVLLENYLIELCKFYKTFPKEIHGTKEEDQYLRAIASMVNVCFSEEKLQFKDDKGKIFDWTSFNKEEKELPREKLIKILSTYENNKSCIDENGCFDFAAAKKFAK